MSRLVGVFVGQPQTLTLPDGTEWRSSIFRKPFDGPIAVGRRGLAGDRVADTRNHGTIDMAVCFYPLGHYGLWNEEFGCALGPGGVGENFTVDQASEQSVCIGDVLQIGTATLQVSQPRFPCAKQERRTGVAGFLARVKETRRVGWYGRVLEPGVVQNGDAIELLERPHEGVTVDRAISPLLGPKNAPLARELMEIEALSQGWKWMLRSGLS